jgi:hypothetical protein
MRRITTAAILSAGIALVSSAPASGSAEFDKYPASCDGHPAKAHVQWAKGTVDHAYSKGRLPDKKPIRDGERDRLRQQKFCVQHNDLRERIADYRANAADRYRRWWMATQEPEGFPSRESVCGSCAAKLDAIAACESGGDPTAVNAAGYYGKYQFDTGTWASVGGSGNPAEASEAEQDYRAALLYARAGSSPWPVCGV